jgi:hypothetical protein
MKRLIPGSMLMLTAVVGAAFASDPVQAQTSYKPVPLYQPWRGPTYSGTNIGQYYPRLYYQECNRYGCWRQYLWR